MAKAAAAPVRRRSWFWLQGMVCGVVAAIAPGTAVMAVVLLGPGLAMYAIGSPQSRPIARAMIMMGAATTFMPLRLLWEQGGTLDASLGLLGDPARPILAWVASGLGWFVAQVTDLATQFILNAKAANQLRALGKEREALIAEWMDGPAR